MLKFVQMLLTKPEDLYNQSHGQLRSRLFLLLVLLGLSVGLLVSSVLFFGPKIGGAFGYLSKYRNERYDQDTVAPGTPMFGNAPSAVKEKKVDLAGFAESGATVRLFVNGPEVHSTEAEFDGKFFFNEVELISGRNTIFAKATDKDGNESGKSEVLTITVDRKGPKIDIIDPKDGDVIRNLNGRILIKGKVNEKAAIRVNGRLAILKSDYSFEFLLGVGEGNVAVKIEAVDEAGNKSQKEIKVTYVKSGI